MSDTVIFACPGCGIAIVIPTSTPFAELPEACIAAHEVLQRRAVACDDRRMAGAAFAAAARDHLKLNVRGGA